MNLVTQLERAVGDAQVVSEIAALHDRRHDYWISQPPRRPSKGSPRPRPCVPFAREASRM